MDNSTLRFDYSGIDFSSDSTGLRAIKKLYSTLTDGIAGLVLEEDSISDKTISYTDLASSLSGEYDFYMYLKEAVASAGLDDSVSVEMAQTGVYMKFRDSVFFAGDSDVLLDEGQFILEVICDGIRAVDNHVLSIKVSGHTAESSGSSANEWRLSSGRADSVINYMLSLDCCDPSKFSAAGYGKYRPIADNDTEENRRMNRRVEIVFIRNDVDFDDPAVIKELMELEFGSSFISYSDENANTLDIEEEEQPEETAPRSDPDREYTSKSDMLKEMAEGAAETADQTMQ